MSLHRPSTQWVFIIYELMIWFYVLMSLSLWRIMKKISSSTWRPSTHHQTNLNEDLDSPHKTVSRVFTNFLLNWCPSSYLDDFNFQIHHHTCNGLMSLSYSIIIDESPVHQLEDLLMIAWTICFMIWRLHLKLNEESFLRLCWILLLHC